MLEKYIQGNSSPSQETSSIAQSISSSDNNSLVFQMHKEMEGTDKCASALVIFIIYSKQPGCKKKVQLCLKWPV